MLPENRLCLQVMLRTGLRISDVLCLRAADIKRTFWIIEQKTGKRRCVGLPDYLIAQLRRNSRGSIWCFPSPRDKSKHRTRQAVWKDMKRVARALRIDVNASPHSARKIYSVYLYEKYGDLEPVKKALNHDNLTTTLLYCMADKLVDSASDRAVHMRRVRR